MQYVDYQRNDSQQWHNQQGFSFTMEEDPNHTDFRLPLVQKRTKNQYSSRRRVSTRPTYQFLMMASSAVKCLRTRANRHPTWPLALTFTVPQSSLLQSSRSDYLGECVDSTDLQSEFPSNPYQTSMGRSINHAPMGYQLSTYKSVAQYLFCISSIGLQQMGRKQAKQSQQEYRIRDILDLKVQDGREYLLIWWQGYPKREATWQPAQNISHVYDYNEYYQRLKHNYQQRLQEASHQSLPQKEHSQPQQVDPVSQHNSAKSKLINKKKGKRKQSNDVFNSDSDQQQSIKKPSKQAPIHNNKQEQPIVAEPVPQSAVIVPQAAANPIQKTQAPPPAPNEAVNQPGITDPPHKPVQQMTKEELKRHLKNAPVVKIEIRIKEYKGLPYEGRQLSRILASFKRAGEEVYLVELQGEAEPVVVHQDMLRARWARKFADYLLAKQK